MLLWNTRHIQRIIRHIPNRHEHPRGPWAGVPLQLFQAHNVLINWNEMAQLTVFMIMPLC